MAKFNKTLPKVKTLTENLAGGQAYSQSDELALVSLLLTSFVNDQFYRDAQSSLDELRRLIGKIKDKEFVAKAAIYARDRFGMRSITHALAAEVSSDISGTVWGKSFYDKVISRVDDMTEIMSYYLTYKTAKDSPKFPNSLKKGFAKAFNRFDNYQIAKYRNENKDVKLIDVVNLVHPIPTERNAKSLELLVKDQLRSEDTWESKLSKAGQIAQSEEDLSQLKAAAWSELISGRKLGYFALLRNLRNILNQAPDSVPMACKMLVDERLITNSKVLPFRYLTAYQEISKLGVSKEIRDVLLAINTALDISVKNVPALDGDTLVVLDVSSSMRKISDISSLFASILVKSNNCDLMVFDTYARYISYNPMDSVLTTRDKFSFVGGGTNFKSIFQTANRKYDNILILSDMQGWVGYSTPSAEFNQWKNKYGANPHVFSWDLAGYGSLQLPENQVYCLAGFSEKVFDIIKLLKSDRNALLNEIKSIEI